MKSCTQPVFGSMAGDLVKSGTMLLLGIVLGMLLLSPPLHQAPKH